MTKKQQILRYLNWIQLIFSVIFAITITFAYFTYRLPINDVVNSLSTSIISVSRVMEATVKTVEAEQNVILNSKITLTDTGKLIKALNDAAQNQINSIPHYSSDIQSASKAIISLGNTLGSVGTGLAFSIPSLNTNKFPPTIQQVQPLINEAQILKSKADELTKLGNDLLDLSTKFSNDGSRIGIAFVATGESALMVIENVDKALGRLQANDLPIALQDKVDPIVQTNKTLI